MKKEFVIFLDIDGVLNYRRWFETKKHLKNPGPEYDPSRMINRKNLRLVGLLCRITGARVIMSSSWRYGWNQDGTVKQDKSGHSEALTDKLLRGYGVQLEGTTGNKIEKLQGDYTLDEQLLGEFLSRRYPVGLETNRAEFLQYARGSQIIDWIERNNYTGDFLILEDDWKDVAVYNCLKSHLVITSFYKRLGGFRRKHLLKCLLHYWFHK